MTLDLPPKSVAVVLGTRPEVVKLAHIVRLLGDAAFVVHSGQHFDDSLSKVFFDAFGLPDPDVTFDVGGATRGTQIGRATAELDEILRERPIQAVVVQGDTNTVLAGALAANATETFLVHVEAGLRSHDRRMPEEHNRVLADHLADLCAAPTEVNVANLAAEGIAAERVVRTGNTVVEAVEELLPSERRAIVADLGVSGPFVLATLHRPENVDDPDVLRSILEALAKLPVPVVYPIHPRTRRNIDRFELSALLEPLAVVEPLGYIEFLGAAAEAAVIVSDSGGIQEEASIIKRPVAVVRRSTERPEVQGTFAELIAAGPEIAERVTDWLDDLDALHERLADIPSPYGDGSASSRIVTALAERLG